VVVTDNHGCHENSTPITLSGINELVDGIDFTISPNPFTDEVQVLTPASASGKMLIVYDAEGKLVLTTVIKELKTVLPVETLSPGIYICRIGNTVKKLVKE
jgi:hypothetical protein